MPFDTGLFDEVQQAPSPDISNTINYNPRPIEQPSSVEGSTFEQRAQDFINKPSSLAAQQQTYTFNWDATNASRYVGKDNYNILGFDPSLGEENEQRYAQAQTTGQKLKNTIGGWLSGAKNAFVNQITSWKDTASIFQDPTLQSAFHQDELEEVYKKNQQDENQYAIYQTEDDKNSFFSWNNFLKGIQETGPLVGSVTEMGAEMYATTALITATAGALTPEVIGLEAERLTAQVIKESQVLSKTIDTTSNLKKSIAAYKESPNFLNSLDVAKNAMSTGVGGVGKGIQVASKLVPFSNTLNVLGQGISDAAIGTADIARSSARVRALANGVGAVYADFRDLNLGISMAQSNASNTYHQIIQDYKDKIRNTENRDLTISETNDIEAKALEASKTNGALDALAMMYTNKLAFGNILTPSKSIQALIAQQGEGKFLSMIGINSEKIAEQTGEKLFLKDKYFTWRSLVDAIPSKISHGAGFALTVETTKTIDDAAKAFYESKYGISNDKLSFADSLKQSINNQFTPDNAKTFISSFLTGAIAMGVVGEGIREGFKNRDYITNREQWKNRTEENKNNAAEFIQKFNEFYKDPTSSIRDHLAQLAEQSHYDSFLKVAAAFKNNKLFNDLHDDSLRSFIIPAIKNGYADVYLDHLRDFTQNLSAKELFEKFHPNIPYEGNEDLTVSFQEHINEFQQRAKDINSIYKEVYRKFPNPHNPFKYKEGTEERATEMGNYLAFQHAIDSVVWNKDIAQRGVERQTILFNGKGSDKGIRGMDAFKQLSFSTMFNFTQEDAIKGSIETLKAESAAETNSVKKAQIDKLIDAHNEYLTHLSKYKEEYNNTLAITDASKKDITIQALDEKYSKLLKEPFSQTVDAQLKESGRVLSPSEKESAISKYLDYYKLDVESKGQLKLANIITDSQGNWEEYSKIWKNAFKEHVEQTKQAEEDKQNITKENNAKQKGLLGTRYSKDGKIFEVSGVDDKGNIILKEISNDPNVKTNSKISITNEEFEKNYKPNEIIIHTYDPKNPKSIIISDVPLKDGTTTNRTITEGDYFVGDANEIEKGLSYKGEAVNINTNDKIKIVGIFKQNGKDMLMVQINNDQAYPIDAHKFIEESIKRNWVNYKDLNTNQKVFLNYRNQNIRYRIWNDAEKTYENVDAKVQLADDKKNLYVVYKDPTTNEEKRKIFNERDVLYSSKNRSLSEIEHIASIERQRKLEEDFQIQKNLFESRIIQNEKELEEISQRRSQKESLLQELESRTKSMKDEIDSLLKKHEQITKEYEQHLYSQQKYPEKGFKKKYLAVIKEQAKEINTHIENLQNHLLELEKTHEQEKQDLQSLKDLQKNLHSSKELYLKALDELNTTGDAFERNGEETLYNALEKHLEDVKSSLISRPQVQERIEQYIEDTDYQIHLANMNIDHLQKMIDDNRKYLGKVNDIKDLYERVVKAATDEKSLKNFLVDLMYNGNAEERKFATNMLSEQYRAKQDSNRDSFVNIEPDEFDVQAQAARLFVQKVLLESGKYQKELEQTQKEKQQLQEKQQRLLEEHQKLREISDIKDRIDFLKKLNDVFSTLPKEELQEIKNNISWDTEKTAHNNENKEFVTEQTPQSSEEDRGFLDNVFDYSSDKYEVRPVFNANQKQLSIVVGRNYHPEHLELRDDQGNIVRFRIKRNKTKELLLENDRLAILDKQSYTPEDLKNHYNILRALAKNEEILSSPFKESKVYLIGDKEYTVTRYDNDQQLNEREKNAEAYKFNADVDTTNNKIKLFVVTKDTEQNQELLEKFPWLKDVRNEQAYHDDIKVIYVNEENKPVDINGNVIENPTSENIIYRSLHGNDDLLESPLDNEFNKESFLKSEAWRLLKQMFVFQKDSKGQYLDQQLQQAYDELKRFRAQREKIKEDAKSGLVSIPIKGKTDGLPNRSEKNTENKRTKLSITNSLIKDGNWGNPVAPNGLPIKLKIANKKDNDTKNVKPGRLVLVREDGLKFPVNNRAFSEEEKTNILNALKYYAKYKEYLSSDAKKERLTSLYGEERAKEIINDLNKIEKYLNAVTFWGAPSEKDFVEGKYGKNRIWVINGKLYRSFGKDGKLDFMSMPFEPSEIDKNKDSLLEGMFHQVNDKFLSSNDPYIDLHVEETSSPKNEKNNFYDYQLKQNLENVSEGGDVYDNYLHYISVKKDNNGVPVLYTDLIENLKPEANGKNNYESNSLHPVLKQVNLTYDYNEGGYKPTPQEIKRETKQATQQPPKTKVKAKPETKTKQAESKPSETVSVTKPSNEIDWDQNEKLVGTKFTIQKPKGLQNAEIISYNEEKDNFEYKIQETGDIGEMSKKALLENKNGKFNVITSEVAKQETVEEKKPEENINIPNNIVSSQSEVHPVDEPVIATDNGSAIESLQESSDFPKENLSEKEIDELNKHQSCDNNIIEI